jgi:hypothetical protein
LAAGRIGDFLITNMFSIIRSLYNALDFPLRQFFHWSRKGYQVKNESKAQAFGFLAGATRRQQENEADRLLSAYHLSQFIQTSTVKSYRINLYYIGLIEKAFNLADIVLPHEIKAADIGVSDWFYVHALYAALNYYNSTQKRYVELVGYEIDAYRVCQDFYSRYDHAMVYIQDLSGVQYIPRRFSKQSESYNLVTLFFPFIFINDHLEWGLPGGSFVPQTLLEDAWESVAPGGLLLVVNQGEKEHLVQREMFQKLNIPTQIMFVYESKFYQYSHSHHVLVGRK